MVVFIKVILLQKLNKNKASKYDVFKKFLCQFSNIVSMPSVYQNIFQMLFINILTIIYGNLTPYLTPHLTF